MFDPIRNMSDMIASANEENSWALEAILSCNEELTDEAMEAITAAGKKLKELRTNVSVEEILNAFIKGMKAAGVKFATDGKAGKKLHNRAATSAYSGIPVSVATIDGVPLAFCGSKLHLAGPVTVAVKKPNGKAKIVRISARQIAKMYNEDNTALDQEKVKVYGKKLLKYVAETNPETDDLADDGQTAEAEA